MLVLCASLGVGVCRPGRRAPGVTAARVGHRNGRRDGIGGNDRHGRHDRQRRNDRGGRNDGHRAGTTGSARNDGRCRNGCGRRRPAASRERAAPRVKADHSAGPAAGVGAVPAAPPAAGGGSGGSVAVIIPGAGHCTAPTGARIDDARAAYDKWKTDLLTSDGAGGFLRVRRPNSSGAEVNSTVSEGIAYGMLLSVYANDQPTFDKLWQYAKLWPDSHGLMNWYINAAGTQVLGTGAATDADEDMAFALVMADARWGGRGSLDDELPRSRQDADRPHLAVRGRSRRGTTC